MVPGESFFFCVFWHAHKRFASKKRVTFEAHSCKYGEYKLTSLTVSIYEQGRLFTRFASKAINHNYLPLFKRGGRLLPLFYVLIFFNI